MNEQVHHVIETEETIITNLIEVSNHTKRDKEYHYISSANELKKFLRDYFNPTLDMVTKETTMNVTIENIVYTLDFDKYTSIYITDRNNRICKINSKIETLIKYALDNHNVNIKHKNIIVETR